MFNFCAFTSVLRKNNFTYTVLKSGIPVIYIGVGALILVMCVIRHSAERAI